MIFNKLHTLLSATILALLVLSPQKAMADSIDSLEMALKHHAQIQEKIYIHTDNTCYFIGDTLWYKAYVLRSDDLKPTNISKLLYVELLSPDGMLVERQHIVISDNGVTCGQFELKDSLYSGYYELRAYTKWDLNFNVGSKKYTFSDKRKFYNASFCADFFRDFEGLYSRVLPIYAKPQAEGDWTLRYMHSRPKQRLQKDKRTLVCGFFPEGGSLVEGLKQRVAYELTDNHGQAMDLEGQLTDGSVTRPTHMGRGVIEITPTQGEKTKLTFTCDGKNYTFTLPKPAKTGVAMSYNPITKTIEFERKDVTAKALTVTCRGKLAHFQRLNSTSVSLADIHLPTGINEAIIYDEHAKPLASRLFFVNNHDTGGNISVNIETTSEEKTTITPKTTVSPYSRLGINVQAEKVNGAYPKTVSLAVRDTQTDDQTYDNGDILTDMLLSGDLKGFVAYPAYYFASDDEEHTKHLDLLLMVQGWRKYKRIKQARYLPETGLTYEGQVLKRPSTLTTLELDDLNGFDKKSSIADQMLAEAQGTSSGNLYNKVDKDAAEDSENSTNISTDASENTESDASSDIGKGDKSDLHSSRPPKKSVYVEAELIAGGKIAGVVTETDRNGRFRINLPAFYDAGILFVKAYNKQDSLKKCLTAKKGDKHFLDAEAFPDYYVKRDMFFPIYTQPYSWYQVNAPDILFVDEDDTDEILKNSKLAGNHTLQTVVVKGKQRGKRSIDYTKPAFVKDIYQLYNDATDYGLSFGTMNFLAFPQQVATLLFGNMGKAKQFNIRAMTEGSTFFRNYTPTAGESDRNMAQTHMYELLHLNRMQNVRAYTDYEIRVDSCAPDEAYSADVTLVFEPVPCDGKRYVYRDRRYIFDGITYPEHFYNRSYANDTPPDPTDYRRTLYWNPNAKLDENGRFADTFHNNCRETRMRASAAGVNPEGILYTNKP